MINRRYKLPLLPGFVFNNDSIYQQNFPKSQRFIVQNETCMLADVARPTSNGTLILEEGQVPPSPQNHWLLYDKQVLKFDTYFEEKGVKRKCKLFYYLEDDTIQVVEPKVDNSGCYQGTFIHRHRVPLPSSFRQQRSNATNINSRAAEKVGYYSIAHLNVGKSLELYGRSFHLVSCDLFTRLMLQKLGAFVPEDQEMYEEPQFIDSKTEIKPEHQIPGPSQKKFLLLDGLVLKFSGYWDDRHNPCGRLHRLLINYYLSDDTIEVKYDNGTVFVKRGRIPKSGPIIDLGQPDQLLVLNVMEGNKFLVDSSPAANALNKCEWIKDKDLMLGNTINIYGRSVVLTNCDTFTKKYYHTKYGIEEFLPLPMPQCNDNNDTNRLTKAIENLNLPPYNGFGTFEDSAANCNTIIPAPPKKDFIKFLTKDRFGMESNILRFSARLLNDKGSDIRRFIISLFLSDDTITVQEEFTPNTGYKGGRFLERCRLLKPNQDVLNIIKPAYYGPDDFYIGAEIRANDFKFLLTAADEYALDYMEKNCNEFPKSNADLVLSKVKECLKHSYKEVVKHMLEYDSDHSGTISSFEFRETLGREVENVLTEQEFITLIRKFAVRSEYQPGDSILRSKVHDELRRMLFKDVDLLRIELKNRDPNHTGYISRSDAWAVCKTLPVPISSDTLSLILDRLKTNEKGECNHEELLYFLDVENQPADYILQQLSRREDYQKKSYDRIDYTNLIKGLGMEEELRNEAS